MRISTSTDVAKYVPMKRRKIVLILRSVFLRIHGPTKVGFTATVQEYNLKNCKHDPTNVPLIRIAGYHCNFEVLSSTRPSLI